LYIPFGQDNQKYWYQRYILFEKFDEGIQMDREGWYSVTPECIARHIADRVYESGPNQLVLDGMAGVGGNTIQFAKKFPLVFAIELDSDRISLAQRNAEVYNVQNNIEFVLGDYVALAPHFKADMVFLSPPWGGPNYLDQEIFDINEITPNGIELFKMAQKITPNIVYFLPRNADTGQLVNLVEAGEKVEVEQNYINKKFKTLTAYYSNLVNQTYEDTQLQS